jgi:hypothetical protein
MSPDIVYKIVKEADFTIVKSSLDFENEKRESNLYYSRDILMLLKKN